MAQEVMQAIQQQLPMFPQQTQLTFPKLILFLTEQEYEDLGVDFDVNQSWDEKEQLFKLSGKFVKTSNITQSAVCDKNGLWTTALAAAVFIL